MQNEITLIEHYKKYFCTVRADSDALKAEAYHLRYEVYNEKYGIAGVNNEDVEYDQYDDHALHSLLFHKGKNKAIGYTRLIPFANAQIDRLPIEFYCENAFDLNVISIDQLRHDKTGEVSRLSIHPDFRRRALNAPNNKDNVSFENRRFPINYLPMTMTFAALNLMQVANLEYTVALMERSLVIQLRRQGLLIKQIGKAIKLYGDRVPYFIYTEESCANIKPEFKELFNVIAEEFANS